MRQPHDVEDDQQAVVGDDEQAVQRGEGVGLGGAGAEGGGGAVPQPHGLGHQHQAEQRRGHRAAEQQLAPVDGRPALERRRGRERRRQVRHARPLHP